jgi:hypothetical protein
MEVLQEAEPTRPRQYRALFLVAIAFVVVGGFGFFLGVASPVVVPDTTELPLGRVNSIAVDGRGHLFVAAPFYQRVQVYGPEGQFITSIPVDSGGGTFNVGLSEQGRLRVATARTDLLLEYEPNGRLVSRSEGPDSMSEVPPATIAVLGSHT